MTSMHGDIAIVGAAETPQIGVLPAVSMLELHAQAARAAVRDAGLELADVDGIATAGPMAMEVSHYLGMTPRWLDGTMVGGGSFMLLVRHAAALRLHRARARLPARTRDEPYRPGRGGRGAATVGARQPPGRTPQADDRAGGARRSPDRLPVHPADVLCRHRRRRCAGAHHRRARPGPVQRRPRGAGAGLGEAAESVLLSQMEDSGSFHAFRRSSAEAFATAGLTHADIDHLMCYDAFAHLPLYELEDTGLVGRGESGAFVAEGHTSPGGRLPMNTNGGGLSYTHTGMYGMFAIQEAVRQLRGEATVQVPDVRTSFVQGVGLFFAASASLILGVR